MKNYMTIREFEICAIRILDDCSLEIRKVLKEEWYILNGCCYMQLRCIYLQIAAPDQRRELVPRVGLLESALHVPLDDQAGFMVPVDRFRSSGVNVVLAA